MKYFVEVEGITFKVVQEFLDPHLGWQGPHYRFLFEVV